eukprot:2535903-Prymnesium_polylepis.1
MSSFGLTSSRDALSSTSCGCNQGSSGVLRGTQGYSGVIRGNQRRSPRRAARAPTGGDLPYQGRHAILGRHAVVGRVCRIGQGHAILGTVCHIKEAYRIREGVPYWGGGICLPARAARAGC